MHPYFTLFSTSIFVALLSALIIEDLKTLQLSVWKLIALAIITCILLPYCQGNLIQSVVLLCVFLGIDVTFRHLKNQPSLGLGDYIIIFLVGIWIFWDMIPVFLILTGLFGYIIKKLTKATTVFPFSPCIIGAAIIVWVNHILTK